MLSLEYIRQLSDEAAELAAVEGLEPYVPWDVDEIEGYDRFPFPNLGSYNPPGWTCVTWLFVDSSGLGNDYEPALSVRQFIDLLIEYQELGLSLGYGITEVGQFQVHVGVFVPDRHLSALIDEDPEREIYSALYHGKGVYPQL